MKDHPKLYLKRADKPYVFRDLEIFSPSISRIVFMLDYARRSILDTVRGLSITQLDTQVLKRGNTIALLLSHIAQVEKFYQAVTFHGEWPSGEAGESVFNKANRERIGGQDLEYYLDMLRAIRSETLEEMTRRDDNWLHREYSPWKHDTPANNFFCWFHVLEDELRHEGQIAILRKEMELSAE